MTKIVYSIIAVSINSGHCIASLHASSAGRNFLVTSLKNYYISATDLTVALFTSLSRAHIQTRNTSSFIIKMNIYIFFISDVEVCSHLQLKLQV